MGRYFVPYQSAVSYTHLDVYKRQLIDPMNLEQKLEMFKTLVDIGITEIEVGFPSARCV